MKVIDVPDTFMLSAEIEQIKDKIFYHILIIQNKDYTILEKRDAYEELKALDRSLDTKNELCIKLKDKSTKKRLLGLILECKSMSTNILSFLRNNDLSHLDNEMIIKLNNLAYKQIKNTRLNMLIDKRAIQNEGMYQRLEEEASEFIRHLDFNKLYSDNKYIVE
jgi:hypothetical protein